MRAFARRVIVLATLTLAHEVRAQAVQLVQDVYPGADSTWGSSPGLARGAILPDGYLYFAADASGFGSELWRTDGTDLGTTLVRDINPGQYYSTPEQLVVLGSALIFRANDGLHDTELWKSDGTPEGTVLITDLVDGSGPSNPWSLTVFGGAVYFAAGNYPNPTGTELWKTDGTAAGTVLVKDVNPGTNSSSPTSLTVSGGKLFFTAVSGTDGVSPREATARCCSSERDLRSASHSRQRSRYSSLRTPRPVDSTRKGRDRPP